MKREKFGFESGLVELEVNDSGRIIRLNPADAGFAETLYDLVRQLNAIHKEKSAATKDAPEDEQFSLRRSEDAAMREAVDAIFGEGFCGDVFPGMRLFALAEGLTVVENFIFALLDRMDEDITSNLAKRDARIAKYTAKYKKYKK